MIKNVPSLFLISFICLSQMGSVRSEASEYPESALSETASSGIEGNDEMSVESAGEAGLETEPEHEHEHEHEYDSMELEEVQAPLPSDLEDIADHVRNEAPVLPDIDPWGCRKASAAQIYEVNLGNSKRDEFLNRCIRETKSSYWCNQLVHPNWNSQSMFRCTYGSKQVHQLIHPRESTWKHAINAVKIVQELSRKNIRACKIYNWWRPEPYNKNVGGAGGRHPYGTSVDVRFCSEREANRAFTELCKLRKKKRIRAIGHYGSASLHLGIGDRLANTWGKRCR